MSFRDLYDAQLAWVLQTLRRLGVAQADLDDAAHEIFVVVHRKLGTFDASRPVRPWLFGIAFRIARDRLRSQRRRALRLVSDELRPDAPADGDLEARAQARAQLRRVHRALLSLPEERRAAFIMHDLDGFTVPEIATTLEIPINTLYSHLRRARRHVHELLRHDSEARHG